MFSIKNNYQQIQQRILLAEQQANRVDEVQLLAVSKRHTMDKIVSLHQLGQLDFGESYLQEAIEKIEQLQQYPIIWHFIGPIQSNKTRPIAQLFDWVHSVDRLKIAQRLNDQRYQGKTALNICLQVNINTETSKSGFSLSEVNSAVEQVINLPQLKLRGLMAIPKKSAYIDQQKQNFALLKEKFNQLNQQFSLNMDTLSMGMSGDLEAAISQGATIIRVGSALFGERDK
ncbi:MAG: YggS family pyridoxal phosphate-dependent enzyme [Pseudomonadota bacterium]